MPARTSPDFVPPQLATLVSMVPEGAEWVHEVKFDGYRIECLLRKGQARLYTRRGLDWTDRYSGVAAAAAALPVRDALLDGEVVALLPDGRSSFQALQQAMTGERRRPIVYYVFDLLRQDGADLRSLPLAERTRTWLKIKCLNRQEFVVVGFTEPQGSRSGVGALLLGVYDSQGKLRYAGKVGTGMGERLLRSLRARLEPLARDEPPIAGAVGPGLKAVTWVKPVVVVEVAFTEWTDDGRLRHPSLVGVREDKPAREVKREAAR